MAIGAEWEDLPLGGSSVMPPKQLPPLSLGLTGPRLSGTRWGQVRALAVLYRGANHHAPAQRQQTVLWMYAGCVVAWPAPSASGELGQRKQLILGARATILPRMGLSVVHACQGRTAATQQELLLCSLLLLRALTAGVRLVSAAGIDIRCTAGP